MTALGKRKKTFLSDPDWKKIPWVHVKKTPKDLLLDILVDIPTLFEALDTMPHCKDPKQKAGCQEWLYMEYVSLEKRLARWHARFSSDFVTYEENSTVQDAVMPQMLAAAHLSTLYWATCVILYGMVGKVLMVKHGEKRVRGRYVDPEFFCQDILKVIPLFLHFSTGIFRVHLATPPISVATIYLSSLPPDEMKEEKVTLAGYLRDPSCSTIRKFLASMHPQEIITTEKSRR